MPINNDAGRPRFTADDLELLSRVIDKALNGENTPKHEHLGFALLVFQFGGPGISQYASNAKRADMVKALRETAERLERHEDNVRTR